MTPKLRLAFFTMAATLGYLGLAILGRGGFEAFFSHSALIALVIADLVLSSAAVFSGANLNPGEREDRANRWVLAAFALIALLMAYLPAYTDRKEFWTFSLPSVVRCGSGRRLCSGVASADWWPSSPGTRW
jgi:hypothetical protein